MKGDIISKDHLGGYIEGGDSATFFPELWTWLIRERNIKSAIDVGCGDGVALKCFESVLGSENVFGVDGIAQDHPRIETHDYTLGPFAPKGLYDLCWCCEFVEHIEEKFLPNFLETFKASNTILMTHAAPGQQGHHHVNCRTSDYWKGVMAAIGYRFDEVLTAQSRFMAASNKSPYNHFVRSGMAFVRN